MMWKNSHVYSWWLEQHCHQQFNRQSCPMSSCCPSHRPALLYLSFKAMSNLLKPHLALHLVFSTSPYTFDSAYCILFEDLLNYKVLWSLEELHIMPLQETNVCTWVISLCLANFILISARERVNYWPQCWRLQTIENYFGLLFNSSHAMNCPFISAPPTRNAELALVGCHSGCHIFLPWITSDATKGTAWANLNV